MLQRGQSGSGQVEMTRVNTHFRRGLTTQTDGCTVIVFPPILLFLQQPALRCHLVVVILFFPCRLYVTRVQKTQDKNPQNCNDSFSSGSILTTSQQDGDNKDGLNEIHAHE